MSVMFFCGSAGTSVVLWLLSSWTPPSGDPLLTHGPAEGSQGAPSWERVRAGGRGLGEEEDG